MKIKLMILLISVCLNTLSQEKKEFHFVNGTPAYYEKGNDGWGVVDASGKTIVPKVYKQIGSVENLVICKGRNGGIDAYSMYDYSGKCILSDNEDYSGIEYTTSNGEPTFTCKSNKSPVKIYDGNGNIKYIYKIMENPDGFKFLINELTDTIVIPPSKHIENFLFKYNVIYTYLGNKQGAMRLDGSTIIPLGFFGFVDLDNGGLRAKPSGYGSGGYCGYYDMNGRCIIPANKYTDIYSLPNGLFEVILNDKAGVIDSAGNIKFMTKYKTLRPQKDGNGDWYYITALGNGKGKISSTGKVIEEAKPTEVKKEIEEKGFKYIQVIDVNGYYGVKSLDGRTLIPNEYSNIQYNHYMNNYFLLEKNGYRGWANSDGKIIVPCNKYDCVENINTKPYVLVGINGKYGLCDESGKEIIKPLYDDIEIRNGEIIATMGIMKGIVDFDGKLRVPFEYTDIKAETTYKGYQFVKTGNYEVALFKKKGVCDNNGAIIIPPNYTKFKRTDYTHVMTGKKIECYIVEDGETKGIFTLDGKMLFPTGIFKNVTLWSGNNQDVNPNNWYIKTYNDLNADEHLYDLNGNLLSTLTSQDKQYQYLFGQAQMEYNNNNYDKAVELFENVIKMREEAPAYYNLGASLYCLGKYKDAIKNLNYCLKMNPSQNIRDNATKLILDCKMDLQKKRENRINLWIGIIGTAFNVASTVIQTNNTINAYNSEFKNPTSNSNGKDKGKNLDYLLDPRYTIMKVQQNNWNEYLQATRGGQDMSYDEWYALKAQAWAETRNDESSMNSSNYSRNSSLGNSSNTSKISTSNSKMCTRCAGTGWCRTCDGKGWFHGTYGVGKDLLCPNCRNHNGKCSGCGGTGRR